LQQTVLDLLEKMSEFALLVTIKWLYMSSTIATANIKTCFFQMPALWIFNVKWI